MNGSFSWRKALFIISLLLFALWFPRLVDAYFLHLAVAFFLAMILASSWDILARTGQVSVGQAGLFGIGAYTAALLFKWIHLTPVLGMLAGGGVSVVVAALLGYLTLRLRGIYFSITTIAFAEALSVIWLMTPGVTGGAMGLSTPPLFGGDRQQAYYLILGILILCVGVVWMIEATRLNFAFTAIRENEEVANVMGINPTRYKVLAFMISAFFTGFAGGFYSHYNTYIIPYEVFGLGISIACLVTVSYGHQIAYGLILILVVLFMPDGVMGIWRNKILPLFRPVSR
jgi:branched-chain amino acid transport system permease protein